MGANLGATRPDDFSRPADECGQVVGDHARSRTDPDDAERDTGTYRSEQGRVPSEHRQVKPESTRHGKITPCMRGPKGNCALSARPYRSCRPPKSQRGCSEGGASNARIGRITREHSDVEFWVERIHADRSKAVLIGAGATALTTQPPEEACEFTWDGVLFSTAYFDRQADGSVSQLMGRWSDWLFPPGSFGDEPGMLDGTPVLAMSVSGMLAMKEQFPRLRNGRPWRPKDIADIEMLRELTAETRADGHTRASPLGQAPTA